MVDLGTPSCCCKGSVESAGGSELASALSGEGPRAPGPLRLVSSTSCSSEASGLGLFIWLSSGQLSTPMAA